MHTKRIQCGGRLRPAANQLYSIKPIFCLFYPSARNTLSTVNAPARLPGRRKRRMCFGFLGRARRQKKQVLATWMLCGLQKIFILFMHKRGCNKNTVMLLCWERENKLVNLECWGTPNILKRPFSTFTQFQFHFTICFEVANSSCSQWSREGKFHGKMATAAEGMQDPDFCHLIQPTQARFSLVQIPPKILLLRF